MLRILSRILSYRLGLLLLVGSLIALSNQSFAQSTYWYFGQNAGIKFNSNGIPAVISNANNMNTPEGCAILMNNSGSVANYSNGRTLWNGQGIIIANDLNGDKQSIQSALFLPKPNDADTTYLFTLDENVGPNGLCYSVIANQDIVSGMKNINLQNNLTERMCIVQHCNNRDAWLIVHAWNSNAFYAYRITGEGIDTVPVISNVGSIQSGNLLNATGYLKANYLGDRLAMAIMGSAKVELFKFDNINGSISTAITLPDLGAAYGVEFNSAGDRLFVSTASGKLYNYDLSMWNQTDICASKSLISSTNNLLGALQLGPNNRIYVARDNSHFVGRIATPDQLGTACNYNSDFLFLGNAICEAGLPPFVNSSHNFLPLVNVACHGDTSFFSFAGDVLSVDSVLWDFGDSTFCRNNMANNVYANSGIYNCNLYVFHCDEIDTLSFQSQVNDFPKVDLGNDTSFCDNQSITIDASVIGGANYLWQDGSTQNTFLLNSTGKYWVKVQTACGMTSDTIQVLNVWNAPEIRFPSDTNICEGDSLILDGGANALQYQWQNQDAGRYYIVRNKGVYSLSIIDSNSCTSFGEINVEIDLLPFSNLGNDTTICKGDFLVLDGGEAEHYQWQNYHTGKYFSTNLAGEYSVQLSNHCGQLADTILVDVSDCLHYISIPNAFTPNGDNINDYFMPKAINISDYEMHIFNRWGHELFRTNDLYQGWDGTDKGKMSLPGIYSYFIRYRNQDGNFLIKKGFINLIR